MLHEVTALMRNGNIPVPDVIAALQKKRNICIGRRVLRRLLLRTEHKDMPFDADDMILLLSLTDAKEREAGVNFNFTVTSKGRLENVWGMYPEWGRSSNRSESFPVYLWTRGAGNHIYCTDRHT